MRAIITVGISASGKTTWANEFLSTNKGWYNINRDDVRAAIMLNSGLKPVWSNWKWKWENQVTEACDNRLQEAAAGKYNVIISDTNLDLDRRLALVRKLIDLGYVVETKVFDITYDEAVKRDNERANGVGYAVIQKQYQQFLDGVERRVEQNRFLRPAAIVDIDGTVAIMGNHRGPFEWNKVDLDQPHQPVIEMVKGLAAAGYFILFTSGRDGSCRELTTNWINAYISVLTEGVDFALLMRPAGDMRKDTIIKEEIFRNDILGKYNVKVVLDDRPTVCRMWRDLGLNVVQVGNPYVEF